MLRKKVYNPIVTKVALIKANGHKTIVVKLRKKLEGIRVDRNGGGDLMGRRIIRIHYMKSLNTKLIQMRKNIIYLYVLCMYVCGGVYECNVHVCV